MRFAIEIGLNSLSAILFLNLVALGLVVIFGMMKVINMAHGEFVMLGSYSALIITQAGDSFWWGLPLAFLGVGVFGYLLHVLIVRRLLLRADLSTLLATWGASIVLQEVIKLIFGPGQQHVAAPLAGSVDVLGALYPSYRLLAMVISAALLIAVFLLFFRTRFGLTLRATIQNGEMAALLGIPTHVLEGFTFAFGAGLAALAGAVTAPLVAVFPEMGLGPLTNSFLVAMTGGMGNLLGSLFGSAVVAGVKSVASSFISGTAASILVLCLILATMLVKPQGIFRSE